MKKLNSIIHECKSRYKKIIDSLFLIFLIRCNKNDLKVIVGSASTKQTGWISTNYPTLDLTDDATYISLFKVPHSVSRFLAEHVWEHLTLEDGEKAAALCYRFLKPGGVVRIAVPDGYHPDADYIAQVKPGGYGPGADDHKFLYNYQTLSKLFSEQGFQVELLEWFDEMGTFHYQDWDAEDGMIRRSSRYDNRNKVKPNSYTSLVIDAHKLM